MGEQDQDQDDEDFALGLRYAFEMEAAYQEAVSQLTAEFAAAGTEKRPHGNAIRALARDLFRKKQLVAEGELPQKQWDAYFNRVHRERAFSAATKAERRLKTSRLSKQQAADDALISKPRRRTKLEMAGLRAAASETGVKFSQARKSTKNLQVIVKFIGSTSEFMSLTASNPSLWSAREMAALARLIRNPKMKQEAARIVDEAKAGTLQKGGAAVATLERLVRRPGEAGDATFARDIEKLVRAAEKLKRLLSEAGREDAANDLDYAGRVMQGAADRLRGSEGD